MYPGIKIFACQGKVVHIWTFPYLGGIDEVVVGAVPSKGPPPKKKKAKRRKIQGSNLEEICSAEKVKVRCTLPHTRCELNHENGGRMTWAMWELKSFTYRHATDSHVVQ